jgi:hypothetical protein
MERHHAASIAGLSGLRNADDRVASAGSRFADVMRVASLWQTTAARYAKSANLTACND